MQRYRRFLGLPLASSSLTAGVLSGAGARARFVPPELSPFDEVEVAFPLSPAEDLLLTVAVEEGRIARLMFAAAAAGDDDADPRGLSGAELAAALDRHGAAVEGLLDAATAAPPGRPGG